MPLLHCYRCGYSWVPRGRVVRICPTCKSRYWDEPRIRIPRGGGGLGIKEILDPHRKAILRIGRRYGSREIRVFGSVARGSASPTSDVDLLVDFDYEKKVRSSLRSIDMAIELEKVLGRTVEVVTEQALRWDIHPQVIAESVPL